jgi:uncharacterized protein YggE
MHMLSPLAMLAIGLAMLFAVTPTFADCCGEHDPTPTLTVTGDAELEFPADELRITIAVVNSGDEAGQVMKENSRAMQRVIEALKRVGLRDDEYETGRFSINPQYQPRPRDADRNWKPRIVGYVVENSINVKTQQLELIGELIEKSVEAGANNVTSISFGLANPNVHRAKVITEATTNARNDAAALAAGVRRAAQARPDRQPRRRRRPGDADARREDDDGRPRDGGSAHPPGDVTLRAHVTIVYEIEE